MNIKMVSEKTGLSIHTLRYYDKIGLLPGVQRDSKGHRDYSQTDLLFIELVKRLKETKMPLDEIRHFATLRLKGDSTINERVNILENHFLKIDKDIETLKIHQNKIREKIKICKSGGPLKNP